MFLTIFAGLGERIKALFERLSFLGRARRLVRVRRELSLSSLECSVRREVGRMDRPPRFLVLRYVFFNDRVTHPWVENKAIMPVSIFWISFCASLLYATISLLLIPVMGAVSCIFTFMACLVAFERYWNGCRRQPRVQDAEAEGREQPSMSEAIMRRVEQVLDRMQREIVGDGTAHARNVERVREHQRRLGVLKVCLEQCILAECGRITRLTNADGTEELDLSGVPEHLRVPWESLVRSMAMAADALSRLDDFEARVKELFTQAVAPLQERIGRYDALVIIREIAAEGVDVHTMALNVRRDIEAATDQLERRIDVIRESVRMGADCIGDIVAALPYADRTGTNVGDEIERVVNDLAPQSARLRKLA